MVHVGYVRGILVFSLCYYSVNSATAFFFCVCVLKLSGFHSHLLEDSLILYEVINRISQGKHNYLVQV